MFPLLFRRSLQLRPALDVPPSFVASVMKTNIEKLNTQRSQTEAYDKVISEHMQRMLGIVSKVEKKEMINVISSDNSESLLHPSQNSPSKKQNQSITLPEALLYLTNGFNHPTKTLSSSCPAIVKIQKAITDARVFHLEPCNHNTFCIIRNAIIRKRFIPFTLLFLARMQLGGVKIPNGHYQMIANDLLKRSKFGQLINYMNARRFLPFLPDNKFWENLFARLAKRLRNPNDPKAETPLTLIHMAYRFVSMVPNYSVLGLGANSYLSLLDMCLGPNDDFFGNNPDIFNIFMNTFNEFKSKYPLQAQNRHYMAISQYYQSIGNKENCILFEKLAKKLKKRIIK